MPALERFDGREAIDWSAVWAAFDRDGGLIVEHFIARADHLALACR